MKRLMAFVGLAAAVASIWASEATANTFYWRHPGRDPFLGPIRSIQDLRAKYLGNQGLFVERLRMADPSLPAEGIAAGTGSVLETQRGIQPEVLRDGTRLAWMIDGHGVRRNVVVVGDRPGFRVSILGRREGRIYDFHWASACGNITPLGTRPLPRQASRLTSTFRQYRNAAVVRVVPVPVPMPLPWPPPYVGPVWVW